MVNFDTEVKKPTVKNHDGSETGAEDRTRTGDLLITNQLHYQLCYFGNNFKLYPNDQIAQCYLQKSLY